MHKEDLGVVVMYTLVKIFIQIFFFNTYESYKGYD